MTEPSTSTSASETGEVTAVLDAPTPQDGQPAPVQQPKRPEPTIPYSWRTFEPQPVFEYVTDCDRADELLEGLQPCVFGFDVEWKPVFLKGQPENKVALIQLANNEVIYLLQVSAMQRFPESLRAILESETYTKAGVGIQGDAKKVYRDCGVSMKQCIDLSLLARSVDSTWKGKYTNPIGLANLVGTYEFLALGKGKITRSNWEAQLSYNQQEYAANDGHSGYTIYSRLIKMADEMVVPPAESCYSFEVHRGALCDSQGRTWHPNNPNYDPGPPPPPKPPKEKKEGDNGKPNVSGVSRQPPARGRRHYQQQRERSNRGPDRLVGAVSGSSSGHMNGLQRVAGDRAVTNGGRGLMITRLARQPHGGGGGRMGTVNNDELIPGQGRR